MKSKEEGKCEEDVRSSPDTYFTCRYCNGEDHEEYEKAPLEVLHPLHPKHTLHLVSSCDYIASGSRDCYCCNEEIADTFYYCFPCDCAMNIACVEKPPVLSIDIPKWHEHTLTLFPRHNSLTCNACALADSSSPVYMCTLCDLVLHLRCIASLPSVIKISRHHHRLYSTLTFERGEWFCSVCRGKIDTYYGGYFCTKNGCSYAAHSKCATQSNIWDGIELEGVPEEIEEELEPFVRIRDGIIQHFSHQHHHMKLDDNTERDYDENRECQACIMPIYSGNLYSCMQCEFILHEECANLSRKIHHPIHPHPLALVGVYEGVMNVGEPCSACNWMCTTGFFYECRVEECCFKINVQCAMISEPFVHENHIHPLFLTSKPGEWRKCSECNLKRQEETFNCLECDFSLCFRCATLPYSVKYKHDKHMLTQSYGKETSTMAHWCEACEQKITPEQGFYKCDESCCVTLHIGCLIGWDLYMRIGSSWLYETSKVDVLRNSYSMSRHICYCCRRRCPYKIALQCKGAVFCNMECMFRAIPVFFA